MHAVIVPSESFMPARNPLQGLFQADQAHALSRAGAEVGVVCVDADESLAGAIRSRALPRLPGTSVLMRNGLYVSERRVVPLRYGSPKSRGGYWIRGGLDAFSRYTEARGIPDVIHAHNARYAGLLAATIRDRHDIPFVITEHSSVYAQRSLDRRELTSIRPAFALAHDVLVVSETLGDRLIDLGLTTKYRVVPNVVDDCFTKLGPPPADGPFTFIAVGALSDLKNHEGLIEAFARAFPRGEERLEIVGEGPLRRALEDYIARSHLGDRVKLLGALPREEIAAVLDDAHAMVLSSRYETFGVVLVEALAAGRPVVSTNCGGPRSIVTPADGYLVDADDIDALAEALALMVETHHSFDGVEIRRRAIDRFSSAAIGEKLNSILTEAILR